MRIVTDYKHARKIIVEQDAEIERLTAEVKILRAGIDKAFVRRRPRSHLRDALAEISRLNPRFEDGR